MKTRPAATMPIRLRGVEIGHGTDSPRSTGVTAVLFRPPASVVVDVRGGASCTYDTASLAIEATFGRRWAIFFAGGSVYGLDAARGIRTALLSKGDGQRPFQNPNRIVQVSGATLFDLPLKEGPIADYLPLGFQAVENASPTRVRVGRVGAGAGATVGKYLGRRSAMPGGLGYAAVGDGIGPTTGALVVLNSVGAVRDERSHRWVAGARGPGGRIVPPRHNLAGRAAGRETPRGTNLVLVFTNVPLNRSGLHRLAQQGHDGLARAVIPAHTATDGDVVFAATTSRQPAIRSERYPGATADTVGNVAAALVARAAVIAVRPPKR